MSLKITLVFVVIAFSLMMSLPSSYSANPTGEHLMQGIGYGMSKNIVEVADVQIQLKIDENQEITFEKGRILLDAIIHTIKDMDLSFYGGANKFFKIDGTTDDGLKITGTGKLVLLNQNGMVYEIRGVITKQNFTEKIILYVSVQPSNESLQTDLKESITKPDLVMLTKQDFRNYWNENYDIFVKVFDKKINPNPTFDQSLGTVNGAMVNVTLTHEDGSQTKKISGITDKHGYWNGKQYFVENLSKPGRYFVNAVVYHLEGTVSQNQEMFLFGVTTRSSTNGTAP